MIIIGNKCDMENERVVLLDEGEKLASELGTYIFERMLLFAYYYLFL
jgi:hypothetical protein